MAYRIVCRDIDMGWDCDFVAQGKSEDEVLKNVRKHTKEAHGVKELPADANRRLLRLVREDKAA
jgi:predicted small metal-binding protein